MEEIKHEESVCSDIIDLSTPDQGGKSKQKKKKTRKTINSTEQQKIKLDS